MTQTKLKSRFDVLSAAQWLNVQDACMDFGARNIWDYQVRSKNDRDLRVDASIRSHERWVVGKYATSGGKAELRRTQHEIARESRSQYVALLTTTGGMQVEHFQRNSELKACSLALLSSAEDLLIRSSSGAQETYVLCIPSEFVESRVVRPEDACGLSLPVERGIGNIIKQSVLALHQDSSFLSDSEFLASARLVAELIMLALMGVSELQTIESPVRAKTLLHAKRVIRDQLSDPDLTLMGVATECGISLGYLHQLFKQDGRTAWEYLKVARLQHARYLIDQGLCRPNTVTEVALQCGFSNLSQFSTAFKEQFGMSPRDALRTLRHGAAPVHVQ